jgi:vancomycin resistance protein YoaR
MLHHLKPHRGKIWIFTVALSLALVVFISLSYFYASYDGKIYPNVYIGEVNFGGMTKDEARDFLQKRTQNMLSGGLTVNVKDRDIDLNLERYAEDPDLAGDLLHFNNEKTVDALYDAGRQGGDFWASVFAVVKASFTKEKVAAVWEFDRKSLLLFFDKDLSKNESSAENAAITFIGDNLKIKNDKVGLRLNYARLMDDTDERMKSLSPLHLAAEYLPEMPTITREDTAGREADIARVLDLAPINVTRDGQIWTLSRADLKKYLGFEKDGMRVSVVLDEEKSAPFFKTIANAVNVSEENAKFKIENNKVLEFQKSRIGMKLDEEGTRRLINGLFELTSEKKDIVAIVDIVEPAITMDNVNTLGIDELIGTGVSDFSGSPPNRIYNIKTGAEKINGWLLAPGDEFSALRAIGPVDAASGFKKELVIKADKTTPEFGGGLCQIGTTLFRGAIDTGLPIVERRNHSYRVSYYEPAGTDATLYNPSPDLRFINDTGNYILIQAKISGNKLSFEFWGKSDGRTASHTNSVIKNIVNPPPAKYITTADLAPGVKKKVETAHKGADAYFKYTVKYPDERGEVSKTFYSHYKPWAEVWLVGAASAVQ